MQKIGIYTIISPNFGNRLQNYALQEIVTGLGIEAETLNDVTTTCRRAIIKKKIRTLLYKLGAKKFYLPDMDATHKRRIASCEAFSREHIKFSSATVSKYNVASSINDTYDYFVAGSDQIWNPSFRREKLPFLTFANPEKRIAYAASFGVSEVPEEWAKKFGPLINKFAHISVREEAGKDIVKNISHIDAQLVLDPTMLLSASEWKVIEAKPDMLIPKEYVLDYHLGEIDNSLRAEIESISKDYGAEVLFLNDKNNEQLYGVGPAEFLWLIHHSKAVITDSFHGTVFSILFNRPFLVTSRISKTHKSMESRISTLMQLFAGLPSFNKDKYGFVIMDNYEMEEVIDRKRKESIQFLRNSLGL